MISSTNLIIDVICNKCIIPNYSHPSWHGRVCFNSWKGHDYHEFKRAHEIQIEKWWLYWSPDYVSITKGIMAPSGVTTTLGISSTSGSKNASGNGTTESGGTTKGGGLGASISTQGPFPIFNIVVEFFHEL